MRKRLLQIATSLALALWCGLGFWAFSFQYSSSFFQYNLPARLPIFIAMLLATSALPCSAGFQWYRFRQERRTRLTALAWHGASVVVILAVPFTVAGILHHAPPPWRPSADDAMGTGIDMLLVLAAAVAITLLFGLALAVSRRRRQPGTGP